MFWLELNSLNCFVYYLCFLNENNSLHGTDCTIDSSDSALFRSAHFVRVFVPGSEFHFNKNKRQISNKY